MGLNVAVQMDPIERDQHRRRFDLPHHGGGAGARASAVLLHPRPARLRRGAGDRARLAGRGAAREGRPLHASARRPTIDLAEPGRGLAAAGPAVRHGLYHHHPYPRAHPPQDAGGQRPVLGAQLPREAAGARLSRADAADDDRARSRDAEGLQGAARRHHPEAALRQRRRRACSGSTRTTATSPRSGSSSPASTASR